MKIQLKNIFPNCKAFGTGYAGLAGQFTKSYTIDYYDGLIEGVLLTSDSDYIVYVKKCWWDDLQNNRLFECYALSQDDLESHKKTLSKLFESENIKPSYEKCIVNDVVNMKNFILQHNTSLKCHIFCEDILHDIFVLPIWAE